MTLNNIFKACGFKQVDDELAKDINKIIEWQEILKQVNIEGVEPMYDTLGEFNNYISNEDVVVKENVNVLSNAPEQEDNFFLVPKVIKN